MGPFTQWLIRKAISSFLEHELAAFTDGTYIEGDASTAETVHVARLQVRYTVTRTGLEDDTFENVMHFINVAPALAGEPLLDTQKASVESGFNTMYTAMKPWVHPWVSLTQFRWYGLTLGDPIGGPPNRITTSSAGAGTNSTQYPAQVASSITFRTALRRHWGRIYLPGAKVSTYGLSANSDVDGLANGMHSLFAACTAADISPVVFSPQRQAVLSVSAIETDNVPDIIRRRRAKHSTYQKILTS